MSAPRLLLCAPASGGGKTTVTCALLQALVNRGAGPVAFKCGPDYIDPMFHSEIIGAKSRNLDLFFLGRDTARYLLEKNSRGSGLALIEGVMGYYDGIGLSADASAYDLARATGTPAVLVLDGRGRALTAAAAVKGMRDFRPDSGIRGVILNRVSPMLYPRLKEAIEGETGVTVYGYLPNLPGCALESRHLGLVTAAEVAGLREKLSALAAQAVGSPHVRLRGLMAIPPVAAGPDGNRPFFTKMRQLYVDIRSQMDDNKTSFDCLSMGMSGDFEDAVREGATLVRVGTALFGPRPPMHKG